MPTKKDVVDCMSNARRELDAVAEGADEEAWPAPMYEVGWNARQLLSHIASTSSVASFVMTMAGAVPPVAGGGAPFAGEAFNREQVAMREDKTVAEVLDEILGNMRHDLKTVEAADGEILQKHFVAPYGSEGPVARVIIDSVNEHLGGHIADLRGALR